MCRLNGCVLPSWVAQVMITVVCTWPTFWPLTSFFNLRWRAQHWGIWERRVCVCVKRSSGVKTTSHECEMKECCLNREQSYCGDEWPSGSCVREGETPCCSTLTHTRSRMQAQGLYNQVFTSQWGETPQQTCVPLVRMVPPKASTKGHLVCMRMC